MVLNEKRPIKSIIIANISEYYAPLFMQFTEKERIKTWLRPSWAEADMALFWEGDDKLVILPTYPDEKYLTDLGDLLGFTNVQMASPQNMSESICSDILNDTTVFDLLLQKTMDGPPKKIFSWGATRPLYNLLSKLSQAGGIIATPELPKENNFWTVPYLDSKCGFREFCIQLSKEVPEIVVPPGLVCSNIHDAAEVLQSGYFQNGGVVIKSNEGVGGYGTLLYRPGMLSDGYDFGKKLPMCAKYMPIFSATPIIIEEFIENSTETLFSSPSIQGVVSPSGEVKISALAGQIIDKSGRYIGAIISSEMMPEDLGKKLRYIGQRIGQGVAKLGYRGTFSVDTVVDTNDQVYCVEMNARRTSVKYVLDLVNRVFGPLELGSRSIITSERFPLKERQKFSYSYFRSLLSDYLFPMGGKSSGVIITICSSLNIYSRSPQIGFVVIGNNFLEAYDMYTTICKLISDSG